ncbi:AMP-dependent synthetase [Leclercia adecarboxylata]|uniref:AMP-dependent synthetase n=1 Tax=Leclercia adecarboxylata TaxID=83655 RepID=UPI002DB6B444|nr:AMP-dependent synthetase [Leclercia adecarboxylata]MEB6381315.1 AMP-dependent synthetase [Leclercia adecarboxylata]
MHNPLPVSQWLNGPRPDDTPVAWSGDRRWTLGELRHDVSTLTASLQQQEGECWALCFDNSYLFIVALLATLHAGKTPVLPGHSRASLLDEQQRLFSGVLSDSMLNVRGRLILVSSACRGASPFTPLPALDDARAIVLFTSGSTGKPEKISKTLAQLDREASLLAARFGERLQGCSVVSSVVPQHLYGLTFRIVLPMALGLPLHTAMLAYAEQLAALDPTRRYLFISSPAFLKRLDPALAPPPVAVLVSAGGVLEWASACETHRWLGRWPDEIYGSSETGVLAWRSRQAEANLWQPFPGVTFTRDNDVLRVTSPLTDAHGVPLDDILQFADDGRFRLLGRRGRVVKIEEKRISLNEVEQRLLALEGVCEAAALPVTRGGRQGIGALLVLSDAARQQLRQRGRKGQILAWRRALRPWLEPVAIPRYWRILDEMPVNSMNKRVYAQLQELFDGNP